MHDISEHDSEEERECHDGEYGWIDFLEDWDTVGVDYFLEGHEEFIGLEVGGFGETLITLVCGLDEMHLRTVDVPVLS